MPPWQWAVVDADLDPVRGSEQRGRRPVLIVSNEDFNQAMPNLTVLPLTSTQRTLYPAEVLLPRGAAGQPRDSIVMAHQIRTIAKERVARRFGYLDDPSLQTAVRAAMADHLDLPTGSDSASSTSGYGSTPTASPRARRSSSV